MLGLAVASLAVALAYFALLDGWYLVRVPCAVLRARLLQPRVRDLLAEQRYAGRVLPSDLDLLLHMNNARYLREADVARAAHLARCGVLGALRALGARAVLAASCARYRRSLRLLEPFEVRTRLLGWDARAFYLEARFVSLRDGFVCALLRSRQHVLGTSPERVVRHLCKRRDREPQASLRPGAAVCLGLWSHRLRPLLLNASGGVEPPELPEDLRHWIAYNETSSQLLRAESGLSDVVKDQ
ncbi:protein THEM6 isoform X1 [Vulpes vulpes]|uniref:Protein THEM6 n=1 Tax=Vulpes vulpes TaxID=9627 RepID=A0ABM4YHR4_VULVU